MTVKIALPKGRLLDKTAELLHKAGWEVEGYDEKTRLYHLKSRRLPSLSLRVFHEKDIPVQVAVGNYDLGICGLDWVEELLVKYPSSALVKIRNLGYGGGALYAVASRFGRSSTIGEIKAKPGVIRIVSEYPNLAESFALKNRLSQFSIFPVWGGAEVYPPENADLALISGGAEAELYEYGMVPVSKILDFSAFLIANKVSWETKDLGEVVASINNKLPIREESPSAREKVRMVEIPPPKAEEDVIRMALPDGHQQLPTLQLLRKAGIQIDDYPSATGNRRPTINNLEGVMVKVIRPQDMPLQVANGNFDLAITGRDWLKEHLYQFPSSPVREFLDLEFGRVKIVAVVSQKLSVDDVHGLREFSAGRLAPLRVASEYVNIADKYARDNHLGRYRVIPTWGASEAFLPEDADLLIENTQTGRTIAQHNLKIIDTLFESTACLIGNTGVEFSSRKGERIKSIINTLCAAVENMPIENN